MGDGSGRRRLGDILGGVAAPIAQTLDRVAGWDKLPPKLGLFTLLGLRHRLRELNLYDTGRAPSAPSATGPSTARTVDGSGNDPADARMGAAGTRFARNAPPVRETAKLFETPPASVVSERLLTRDEFFPAESLNLLAAAWVQFEVHDWFAHQTDPNDPAYLEYLAQRSDPSAPSNPAPLKSDGPAHGRYRAFVSDQTHWWDASQLYGATQDFANDMRVFTEGKVKEDESLLEAMGPYLDQSGVGASAPVPNLWLGTALFHVLFAKEHNAICERLRNEYSWNDDQRLYDTARLINTAVMAKIHTLEWTPTIIAHPTTDACLRSTWYGLLGPGHRKRFGWLAPDEVLNGIPGSRPSHDGAPYALTEEFVAVYRMHQLLPDDVTFERPWDRSPFASYEFEKLVVDRDADPTARKKKREQQRHDWLHEIGFDNAFYSLGIAHPGAITLHNYPKFLQKFQHFAGDRVTTLDLGQVDIHRTREVGIPRYNNFRRLFRLAPATSFHDIANGNPTWAREIREVYANELENVDLLIGMFAERKPKGFAFSDTAFRVFLLMAARRLRSDRFFTTDFTPGLYTSAGLDWIGDATLKGMLLRHYPELESVLSGVTHPFRPWNRV